MVFYVKWFPRFLYTCFVFPLMLCCKVVEIQLFDQNKVLFLLINTLCWFHYLELFILVWFTRVHCAESGEESSETESIYALKCHISQDVNHLHEGLKHVSPSFLCLLKHDIYMMISFS